MKQDRKGAGIVCLGEGMIEERVGLDGSVSAYYGGDVLNIAIHLARLGFDVAFASAIGADAESDALAAAWQAEGLDTALLTRHGQRSVGRYRIALDREGERTFAYQRDMSAAREMFAMPGQARWRDALADADLFVFSLISLAILPDRGRQDLLETADRIRRQGGKVAFDGNYRPLLWSGAERARHWRDRAVALADFGLPTLEDEMALGGGNAAVVAEAWRDLGCGEVLVKLGAAGCRLPDGSTLAPPEALRPVDTSGAGDAFDAGYLAARMRGGDPHDAAMAGHRLAGWAIMRNGAIPRRDEAAPYSNSTRWT